MVYQILVINGPNLNLLGEREPDIYGALTLEDIEKRMISYAERVGARLRFFQSNSESDIIEMLHDARHKAEGVVANFGAYTHTSVAIRDAIVATGLPVVEVHISNVHTRESFRRHSYVTEVCMGTVSGFGWQSYLLALQGLVVGLAERERMRNAG